MAGAESPAPLASSFSAMNIAIGTYDGTVAGLSLSEDTTSSLNLETHFASPMHAAAVRSCALRGSTLVTGGADEVMRIYDVARRVEVGTLLHHDGTVNSVRFADDHGRNLLFSAADDAAICVWRVADWQLLKRLTGHQTAVLDVAVHPSATVALSIAKDRSLFMWNLARGKISFSGKTKGGPATAIQWSPSGSNYFICADRNLKISSIDGRSTNTFVHDKKVACAVYLDDHIVATGGEERVVRLWDVRSKQTSVSAFSHDARVCGLSFVDGLLISADSGGGLKIWDHRKGGDPRIETTLATNARLTTMAAAHQVPQSSLSASKGEEVEDEQAEAGDQDDKDNGAKGSKLNGKQARPEGTASEGTASEGTASQRKRKKRKNRS